MDLRERIVAAVVAGGSVQSVADRFCVSHDSVGRLQLKHQRGQSLAPRPHPGRAPRVGGEDEAALAALVESHPSATIEEMRMLWEQDTGVLLAHSTMHNALRRVGARFKKTPVAKERDEQKRAVFQEQIAQVPLERLVFLDECGFASNLCRLYGWALGGARCVDVVPQTRAKNRSCVGAFSLPGPTMPRACGRCGRSWGRGMALCSRCLCAKSCWSVCRPPVC